MIEKLKPEQFDRMYALMEQSFPADEYRSYEEQRALLQDPRYCVYVLPDPEAGGIQGFLAAWHFEHFVFFEHFAVDPRYRNSGVGSRMLKELTGQIDDLICLEVELPETELTKRRVGFYERNGFCFNDYPYMQPPISADRKPVPLRIMTTGQPVSREAFEEIRHTLYREVYHVSGEYKAQI